MVFAVAAVLTLTLVTAESIVALAIVLIEGPAALAVLVSAALAGQWFVAALGLSDRPYGERLVFGAALGIGLLSLVTLALGGAAVLSRATAWAMVLVLLAAGLARAAIDRRRAPLPAHEPAGPAPRRADATAADTWSWLLLVPFAAIALLAAVLPPGVLWREEGFGYDVLEYHLAVPKAFFEAKAITFLPGNVYSHFPLNSEMLSLLVMTLRGEAIESAMMAQLVNVALAALLVAGAYQCGRTFSPRAGAVAGILVGSAPWVTYLAGIAYVEVGMLAMGAVALAAVLRSERDPSRSTRWSVPAGLLAGLACGFKYTALALIALPLGALLALAPGGWPGRARNLWRFALAAGLAFSPYLVRNAVHTHNPLFPLGYSAFGAKAGLWDAGLEARWQRAHGSAAAERDPSPVWVRSVARSLGDWRIGCLAVVLGAAGAVTVRDRLTAGLVLVAAVQFVLWLTATHLFARFAVVLLLPLVVLGGRAADRWLPAARASSSDRPRPRSSILRGALLRALFIAGVLLNLYHLAGLYYHHTRVGPAREPIRAYGQLAWFTEGQWPGTDHVGAINRLPAGAKVMLVGEARTFYVRRACECATAFNHHPLAEAAERLADDGDLMRWLRRRGTTHLLVHWDELARLDGTYGLDSGLNAALVPRLTAAGLVHKEDFRYEESGSPYATLYEVPRDE